MQSVLLHPEILCEVFDIDPLANFFSDTCVATWSKNGLIRKFWSMHLCSMKMPMY